MLVQFSVGNFRSFRARQIFSMVASAGSEFSENVYHSKIPGVPDLLTCTAIYGPNASGKTNLVKAMIAMKNIILDSAKYNDSKDAIPVKHFKLDDEMESKPSRFEVIFVVDNVKYQYGFAANSSRIEEEWLYAYPKKIRQMWFERFWDDELNSFRIEIGNNLTNKASRKDILISSTKPWSLFFSTAVMLNEPKIIPIQSWFLKQFRIAGKQGISGQYTCRSCNDKKTKNKILDFLKSADLPVTDIIIEETKFDPKNIPDSLPEEIKHLLASQLENEEFIVPKFIHTGIDGKKVLFDFEDESDGTQRIFELAAPLIDVLENGRVFVVDELNDSLHPKLVEYIVKLFSNPATNPNNAQLIFTTHETSILDQNILRRDQFWFCKKNRFIETEIYSLMDFSPKKGRDNIEKNYLSGRYGAVPYISQKLNLSEEE